MKKIEKILIANRGEIACRVIRTAREMGIATVAVYSDADRDALHVRTADEAVHIGPAPAAESYLVIDKIIDAATKMGADAIHPGYGFLSENPAFVRACEKAGVTFIGPSAEAMEAMGLKDAAKALMIEAGVPVTPGYQGENQDPDVLAGQASEIGYPVLIKAVAGGGGKGMRKVDKASDFKDALASCQREATASFGNDHVLIEKYILSPRHIEVQIFGDRHGHVIHLFERDCSLQRRHQKVIEEAPAPGMTEDVRVAMTSAAIRAAEAVDYVGAGTVEFIVDGSGELRTDGFWFMEMNTRLQVEHPVTEEITGLDLVEWQIRVAQGEALPAQDTITLEGHAIEARLYAEDPDTDFTPSVGRLHHFRLPGDDVRVDTGFEPGDMVSRHYDPMIAKLIVHAPSREQAIDHLRRATSRTSTHPVKTNAAFLQALLRTDRFRAGDVDTDFIADHDLSSRALRLEKLAKRVGPKETGGPFGSVSGWRLNGPTRQRMHAYVDGVVTELPLRPGKAKAGIVRVGDRAVKVGMPSDLLDAALGADTVSAPMPGKVISILVAPGDAVTADQPLVILEAMKMEMTLKSPRDGIVAEVTAKAAQLVDDGEALVRLEES
ncbi:acetyl-CoA carboxylase biotin carboxylase subunit [Algimonas porphyrae]|uniref:3-methylcrotonyl-CoA carboxylase subunit alpha n=1 Tax=Algimonas porphyrae TaxID=1128113 RepID=A0ABQ5V2B0_9PROT|nr:acetyl/propionyl/methylcrotonyl-CoA carboxylase subunit alpha [Algimonas porphyrae]GLQ21598.1 3-methylcrotonyl-CoA carboxylase subunit alpha [Algimonas porphyrae]